MQSKRVLAQQSGGRNLPDPHVRPPPTPTPMAPFGCASPLLSPTVTGVSIGDPCTLRPPRLTGSSSPPSSPPEDIPCDVPLAVDLFKMRAVSLPELVFCGWGKPVKKWKDWVKQMAREDKFVKVWRAAGIEDAILNSTVHISQSNKAMLALMGFWCPSTCTFVLPWGEVGFTLEDAHILGNLPVWGSPLQRLLTDEEERLRIRLVHVREMLWKTQKKSGLRARVTHSCWINWFLGLDDDDDELQHLGFLAYWLSKRVVPCKPLHEVPSAVFGIAARLSRGERIALAPAVTANIYSDLTTITRSLCDCQGRKEGIKIEVWGQFRLVQAWLWERFDCLSPKVQNPINQLYSRVRIARWDNKQIRLPYHEAVKAFYDSQSFARRPYINREEEGWVKPQWYVREGQSIVVDEHSPIWVYDVLAIISAAGLVGLASEETIPMGQYKPYRVSMQLGYDQTIPTFSGLLVTPCDSCTMCPAGIKFYIPSITRDCNALKGYGRWWEDYTVRYAVMLRARSELKEQMRKKRKIDDANDDDDSPMEHGKMEKNILQVENETAHQKRGPKFVQESTNSTRDPIIQVLDDETPDEDNSENVSKDGKSKKGRLADDVKVEHDINNSKSVSRDDNAEERRLPVSVKSENQSVHHEEPNFMEKPTKSTGEAPNIIIIDNEQGEDMKPKDEEHGPQPHKDGVDESDSDDALVDELEEFLTWGLQAELLSNVSSPSTSGSSERCTKHDHRNARDATIVGDCIVAEVISKYPIFFDMIPQYPHYHGLLQSNVGEGMKKIVYTSLWYTLVGLMQKALRTTCQTRACEIEQLTEEARYLEELGFDVRHLIARLKQPEKRLRRLECAKTALKRVRENAEKQSSLSNISRAHISNLWKAVKDAEINVLEREWDIKMLTKCLNSK